MPNLVLVDVDPTSRRWIVIDAGYVYKDLIKELPGSSWDRKRRLWRVPLSWASCLALRATFGDNLRIGSDLNRWARSERSVRVDPALACREALSNDDESYGADLFPHQRADVNFLATAQQALLGNEPGTGKTASTIRALKTLTDRGETVLPALVVCPNSVKLSWRREIERWWPGRSVVVVTGTATQRRNQLATESDFYVINWESLRTHSRLAPYGSVALRRCSACGGEDSSLSATRCEVHVRELNEMVFGAVVADEAHRIKDPKSKMTRALWSASGDARYRFALTGTPISNNVADLWPVLHWLSSAEWPGKTKWLERMCSIMYDAWGGMIISGIKPERQDEFDATFLPRFRRVPKAAVLKSLPPIVQERRDVEMTSKQAAAYKSMSEDLIAEVESGSVVASTVLVRTSRLMQFASSYGEMTVVGSDDERLVLTDPSSKIDSFMSDLADFGDASVVVFAQSKQLINLLSARMKSHKVPHVLLTGDQNEFERDDAVSDFQNKRVQFILCTIQAGGVGLTLTAGSIMVFLQRSWSMIDMEQAKNRCHRPGAEVHDSILIIDYVTPGTVEEAQLGALDGKGERLEDIVRDREMLRKALYGGIER